MCPFFTPLLTTILLFLVLGCIITEQQQILGRLMIPFGHYLLVVFFYIVMVAMVTCINTDAGCKRTSKQELIRLDVVKKVDVYRYRVSFSETGLAHLWPQFSDLIKQITMHYESRFVHEQYVWGFLSWLI